MSSKVQKKQKYSAVIIGTGRIASGFDSPHSKHVLSHAHAIMKHPRLNLVGMMDVNTVVGKKEARKWKTNFYRSIDSMLTTLKPDIVVIATPDSTHVEILSQVLRTHPRLIICEKPIVTKRQEIANVRKEVSHYDVPVIVNFRRRFDPVVQAVREALVSGAYGKVISAHGIYTKGILHNGSHMIDLARCLFGEMKNFATHFKVNDFPSGAPSVGGIATFDRCPQFYLMTADERAFSIFELEIITEKKRLRFVDEGLSLVSQDVIPDPMYRGYRILSKPKPQTTKLINTMSYIFDNAVSVIDGTEIPRSGIDDALMTHEACFQLFDSLSRK